MAGLWLTCNMLTEHLQLDYHKVHLLLNHYNLMALSLQDVQNQLCELTGDSSDKEEEEVGRDEYELEDGDEDFEGGSAGPTEEVD